MIIKNLLYIYQAENYYNFRFLKFVYKHWCWWSLEKRQKIKWTVKTRTLQFFSWILFLSIIFPPFFYFKKIGVLLVILGIIFLPFQIILVNFFLFPIEKIIKSYKIFKAKKIVNKYKNKIKIIGITGSYGKTSTKEILYTILSEKFKILKPKKNINTELGVAEFIINHANDFSNKEIFIVEMGAFRCGEIKKICNLTYPDYAILTGIGEAHLEKFGSLEAIIKTKFELPEAAKIASFLNIDNENIRLNHHRFNIKNKVFCSSEKITNLKPLENFQGIEFDYDGIHLKTKLLALHNAILIGLCVELARKIGMSDQEIIQGVAKIKTISHRLEPIYNPNSHVWIIDDSYNGNFQGFLSGLEVLERASGRKIILTPGLVEQGDNLKEVHKKIGEEYARRKIDLVLLIKNSVTKYIEEGMLNYNFKNYKFYNTTEEAHKDLSNILRQGDTIIFQNDWPDNYF